MSVLQSGRKRHTPHNFDSSKVLDALSKLIDKSGLRLQDIATLSGYHYSDISDLRLKRGRRGGVLRRPLRFYEDVAEALGYDIVLVPRTPGKSASTRTKQDFP